MPAPNVLLTTLATSDGNPITRFKPSFSVSPANMVVVSISKIVINGAGQKAKEIKVFLVYLVKGLKENSVEAKNVANEPIEINVRAAWNSSHLLRISSQLAGKVEAVHNFIWLSIGTSIPTVIYNVIKMSTEAKALK